MNTFSLAEFCKIPPAHTPKIVGIGASTGGIDALSEVLSNLSPNTLPILIVQHTSNRSGSSLVHLFEKICAARVIPASSGIPINKGKVYIACGNEEHLTVSENNMSSICCEAAPRETGHRPSIDKLFSSLSVFGKKSIGFILTGMGRDGVSGLNSMRKMGSHTFAQDEASSFVYGMPRVAFETGAASHQISLRDIAPLINRLSERSHG